MKKKQTKKRNPTDITLRNLRAVNKHIKRLDNEIDRTFIVLSSGIADLNRCMAINVESLNFRLVKLETKRGRK